MFYFIIFLAIIFVIIYSLFFSNKAVMKNALKKNKKVKICDFEEGSVSTISGTIVHAGKTLRAPLSSRTCSYYHILVEKHSGGKNSHWRTFVEEKKSGDVIIKEGDSYAIIQAGKTTNTYIIPDKHYTSGFLNDATPELKQYLETQGQSSEGVLGMNRTLRYQEGILEEGETITVSGKGIWKRTADFHLNIPSEKILLIVPPQQEPIYLTDDPNINRELNPVVE